MKQITIDTIVSELTDGLTYTQEQLQQIRKWLIEYQTANQLTLKQLRDLCWEDSVWIFDQIFN